MERIYLKDKIIKILKNNNFIDKDIERISLELSLKDTFGLSSINLVELIVAIEQEFEFEFDDEDLILDNYDSIKSIMDKVAKYI